MQLLRLRPGECVLLGYFAYIACLTAVWRLPSSIQALALLLPLVVIALAYLESTYGSNATSVARECLVPCLVLIAYQQVRWFQRPFDFALVPRASLRAHGSKDPLTLSEGRACEAAVQVPCDCALVPLRQAQGRLALRSGRTGLGRHAWHCSTYFVSNT